LIPAALPAQFQRAGAEIGRQARRLMDEVGSAYLQVAMDPANIFPAGTLPRMQEVMEVALALAHASNLDRDGDAGHLAAAEGKLDCGLCLRLLRANWFNGPLLLHGLSRAQVPECVASFAGGYRCVFSIPDSFWMAVY